MREFITRILASKFVRFFWVALVGVMLDVALFALLVGLGVRPSLSSIVSNSIAVGLGYFASSRIVFRVRYSPGRLITYVVWYAISITGFALAIDAAWSHFGGSATLWKVASLPVSFIVNFLVVNYVVLRPGGDADETRASL